MRKHIALWVAFLIVAVVGVVAGAASSAGAATSASAATVTSFCRVGPDPVEIPANRHVVNDGVSLRDFAHLHHQDVSSIVAYTVFCGEQHRLAAYINRGYLRRPLPKGTVLWTEPWYLTRHIAPRHASAAQFRACESAVTAAVVQGVKVTSGQSTVAIRTYCRNLSPRQTAMVEYIATHL